MDSRGEERKGKAKANMVSNDGEGKKQCWMAHLAKDKNGRQRPETIERSSPGLFHLLALRELMLNGIEQYNKAHQGVHYSSRVNQYSVL